MAAKDKKEKEAEPKKVQNSEKELEEINKVLEELDLDYESTTRDPSLISITPEKQPQEEAPSVPTVSAPVEFPEVPAVEEPIVAPVGEPAVSAPVEFPEVPAVDEPAPEKKISDELSFLDELDKTQADVPQKAAEVPEVTEIPFSEAPPIKEKISEEAPPVQEQLPAVKEKKEGIDLSDEQVLQIYQKIFLFEPQLKKIVGRVIINEELPAGDLEVLFDHLLSEEKESVIKTFIEQKLNIKIQEKKAEKPSHEIQKRLKPSIIDVIKHDFIPIIRLAVPVLAVIVFLGVLVISPLIKKNKAEKLINQGVNLIYTGKPGNFNKAEEIFNKAVKIKKNYYQGYLDYGDAYLKVDKFTKAKQKYEYIKNIDEDNKIPYFKIGDLYDKQQQYNDAITEYKKVLELDKKDVLALDKIAKIYYDKNKKNQPEESLKIYKEIINNEKDNIHAHYGLLSLYILNKDLDNIEKEHYQVLSKGKGYKDLERLTSLAEFYIDYKTDNSAKKEDLYNKAEDTLKRVLKEDKKYPEAYYQYARLYRKRRDFRNAFNSIKNAKDFDRDVKYDNFLGEIYLQQNKMNLAIEIFQEGEEKDPDFAKISYNLGNINYYELANYGKAKTKYEKAYEKLKNEYYDLSYNLGWISYMNYDLEDANKYFIKAREVYKKENPYINFALGNTYLKLGKYDLAASEYLDVIDYYKEKYGEYPSVNSGNKEMVQAMKLLSAVYNNLGVCKINSTAEKKALIYFWKAVESAKKLGFSNENPFARANIQYVLQGKNKVVKEPAIHDEIKKYLIKNPYEEIPF